MATIIEIRRLSIKCTYSTSINYDRPITRARSRREIKKLEHF
jgi:hypothetical protein